MLSAKENFLETIKPDGKPDRLVKQYEGAVFIRLTQQHPISVATVIRVWIL